MTYSIVAYSPDDESWGVAVATRSLAVGALVPAAQFRAGALATQALTNMSYRETGLSLLRAGRGADEVVAALLADDPDRERRQLGVVDRGGVAAVWTGGLCEPYAGSRTGAGFVVQGNLLAGPQVLDAMAEEWFAGAAGAAEQGFADRLLAVLVAGEAAGGDRRGRQSAALYTVGPGESIGIGSSVQVDLRVDDAPDPLAELRRLLTLRYHGLGTR